MKPSKVEVECLFDICHFSVPVPCSGDEPRGYKEYKKPTSVNKLIELGLAKKGRRGIVATFNGMAEMAKYHMRDSQNQLDNDN